MNKKINVLVKKWFDNINGNTYHSIQFELNNKIIHSGRTYGYGTQYKVTFKEYFKKHFKKRNFKLYEPNYLIINNCKKQQLNEISNYTK
jgi:hypothetical protein